MSSRTKRIQRRRGRPARVRASEAAQALTSVHVSARVKAEIVAEARALGVSLSMYVAAVLDGVEARERVIAAAKKIRAAKAEHVAVEAAAQELVADLAEAAVL